MVLNDFHFFCYLLFFLFLIFFFFFFFFRWDGSRFCIQPFSDLVGALIYIYLKIVFFVNQNVLFIDGCIQ